MNGQAPTEQQRNSQTRTYTYTCVRRAWSRLSHKTQTEIVVTREQRL